MTETKESVLNRVDEVLASKELLDQPRSLLLVKLIQFCIAFAPHLAERYWQQLGSVKTKLPADIQTEVNDLRTSLEDSLPSNAKGFSADMLAEIKKAQECGNPEETKIRLQECEAQTKKRFMLSGKGIIYTALVEAWNLIDRSEAIQHLKNVSGRLQEGYIARWNKVKPFTVAEWEALAASIGMGSIEKSIISILDDNQQTLALPEKILSQAAARILASMQQWTAPVINQLEITKIFGKYLRLLDLHVSNVQPALIQQLLEELYTQLTKAGWLEASWMLRFALIEVLFDIGSKPDSPIASVIKPDYIEHLASKTPQHMINYLWSEWGSAFCTDADAPQVFNTVMQKTGNDPDSQAWFLVNLVKRGFGKIAFELAAQCSNSQNLLVRLRRCWVSTHSESAKAHISMSDMTGDPVGEFLIQSNAKERADYLKKVTEDGKKPLPGSLWAGSGTEQEAEGLRGFWQNLSKGAKSTDAVVLEYLKINPLYSSYSVATKKEDQFSETLRVNGFGEYRYNLIDSALLEAFVFWGDQQPDQVHTVLSAMWHAIRPDDPIIRTDWLRNAILSRCINVFSADQNVLVGDFLDWFQKELVQKGRSWQIGKQIITIKYPPTSPMQFCLSAASAASPFSLTRRDRLVIAGLEKFPLDPLVVEAAAQVFNSGKEILALQAPVSLKPDLMPFWQNGIIKNSLQVILTSFVLAKINEGVPNKNTWSDY